MSAYRLIHPARRGRKAHLLPPAAIPAPVGLLLDGERALCGYRLDWHAVWRVVSHTEVPLCDHCRRQQEGSR